MATDRRRRTPLTQRHCVESLENRTLLAAFSWNTDADGNWNDPANWAGPGGVPGTGDSVTIDRGTADPIITVDSSVRAQTLIATEQIVVAGGTLKISGDASIQAMTLQSGELDIDGTTTLTGELNWQGGNLYTSSLDVQDTGTLYVHNSETGSFSGVISNEGLIDQDAPFRTPFRNSAFNNLSDGEWILRSDFHATGVHATEFVNHGVFRKTGETEAAFHNTNDRFRHLVGSSVIVDNGTLLLPRSGSQSEPSTGAHFEVAGGAVLDLIGGDSYFVGSYSGAGTGRIEHSRHRLDVRDAAGGTGVTFDFPEGLYHWTGGVLYTDSSDGDTFVNQGSMTWSGDQDRQLWGQEFHNSGLITQTDTGHSLLNSTGQGTWLHNSGRFEHAGTGHLIGGRFLNHGTVKNTAGDTEFQTQLHNHNGSVFEAADGHVRLTSGGEFQTSQVRAGSGGVVEFAQAGSRNFQLLAGATLTGTGAGRIEFSAGRIESVNSDGRLHFAKNVFHWTGGEFFRDITLTGEMTISGATEKRILNGFTNAGNVIHTAGSVVNSSSTGIMNTRTGVWELQGDAAFGGQAFVTAKFLNAGILRKTGTGRAQVTDGGVALSHLGGTVEILEGDLVANHSGSASGTGGHFNVAAGATFEITGSFDSTGRYTGEGSGQVLISAAPRGGLILDFPEGQGTLSVPDTSHVHDVMNEGFLTVDGNGQQQRFGWFRNRGTLVQAPGTEVQMRNYSLVVNEGDWELQGNASITFHAFDRVGADFSNVGTLRKTGPIATSLISTGDSHLPVFSNSGTVEVLAGTLEIHERNLKQLDTAAGLLGGGRWQVGEFSTLRFVDADGATPPINTSDAQIVLSGPSSEFSNIDALQTNRGHLRISDGRNLTFPGSLTNSGTEATIRLNNVVSVASGRLVGVALDSRNGRMITHARNERLDGEPIFRIRNTAGAETGNPIMQPGGPVNVSGIDVASVDLNIGGTVVPAGTLVFLHAETTPATLYALDPVSGQVLASVEVPDVASNQPGVAVQPTRGTVFALGQNGTITEINPVDGTTVDSLSVRPTGASFFSVSWGGIDINAQGNLMVIGSGQQRIRELTPTGDFVRDIDISLAGLKQTSFSDIAVNDTTGEIYLTTESGLLYQLSSVQTDVRAELTVGPDSTLSVNSLNAVGSTLRVEIEGRPGTGQFGRIAVAETAEIDASVIDVSLTGGFAPVKDDIYEVITYQQKTGTPSAVTGLDPFFSATIGSTNVTLNALNSGTDLAVVQDGITVPATTIPGESIEITWTVRNLSTTTLTGGWTDSVYLSRDLRISVDDIVLTRRERTDPLNGLSEYEETLTTTFPGVTDGPWFVLVVADSKAEVADVNRGNNFAASATPVQSQAQTLMFDTPVNGTINSGQDLFFRLDVTEAGNVQLNLNLDVPLQAEFYVSHRSIPTRSDFDFHLPNLNDLTRLIKMVAPLHGPWYLWMHGLNNAAGGEDFTLTARQVTFGVDDITPTRGDTSSTALITVSGAGFTPDAVVELLDVGNAVAATAPAQFSGPESVFARLDLTGLTPGDYTVQVRDTRGVATAATPFVVTTGNPGRLTFRMIGTGRIRPGGSATGWLEYTNVGGGDVDSPLVVLEAEGGTIRRLESAIPGSEVLALLALGEADGSARTVIAPGETARVPIRVTAESSAVVVKVHTLREIPIERVIFPRVKAPCNCLLEPIVIPAPDPFQPDWNARKDDLRPSFIDSEAWDAIYPNFVESVGTDIGDFEDMLRRNADYLSSIGYQDLSVDTLITFEMQRASNWGELVVRNYIGSMGRGIAGPGDVRLTFDADQHATLRNAWGRIIYLFDGDRYVAGNPLDRSTLRPDGTGWEISQQSGNRLLFDEDGHLVRMENAGGSGITFTVDAGQVVSATQDNGDKINYEYDQNGLLTRTTYPSGQVVDLTYDATDQYLISAASGQIQITLSHVTQGPRSALHAIQSVVVNGGAEYQYTYDDRGRLIAEQTAGGEIDIHYRYDQPGSVTVVYADGAEFTQQTGLFGELRRSIDPLGLLTSFANDENGLVTAIVDAAGFRTEIERDQAGRIKQSVNSSGHTTQYSYDAFGDLFVLQDARLQSTAYVNNAQGNLESVTYQDGSQEYFQYDGQGELVRSTNRNGDDVVWSYDAHGRLTGIEYAADGSTKTFVYNDRNYLVSATNSYGTLQFTYDQFDNLTRVDYPAGRFVEYTYDAAGRRLRTADSSGTSFTYTYDAIGRLAAVVDDAARPILSYQYDPNDDVSRIDNANGTSTRLTYDASGRVVTQNTHAADDSVLWRHEYTYDAVGNVATMRTNAGLWEYAYDPTGQLIQVTEPGGAATSYTYDEVGNRIAVHGASNAVYDTDEMNRYRSAGRFTYTYDPSGNVIRKTDGSRIWDYTWGTNGRLARVDGPDGTLRYEYDALDQLVAMTRNGVRTEWLSDVLRQTPLSRFDAGGSRLSGFVTASGLAAEITPDNSLEFFAFDAIGNTVGITGSTGSVVNEYSWMPFGESVQATESRENLFQFGGGFGVTTTGDGLLRMGYRHYDPQIGRFVSEDPIGFLGGDVNVYRYARNQPNVLADPSGLQPGGIGGAGHNNNNNNNFHNNERINNQNQNQLNSEQIENGQKAGQKNHIETHGRGKPLVNDDTSTIRSFDPDADDDISRVNLDWGDTGDEFEDEAGRRLRKKGKKYAIGAIPVVGTIVAGIIIVDQVSEIDSVEEGLEVLKEEGLSAIPGYDAMMLGLDLEKIGPDGIEELAEDLGRSGKDKLLEYMPDWVREADDAVSSFADYYGDWNNRGAWLSALTFGWFVQPSNDPNDITGPAGVGDGNFITGEQILPYTIRFENKDDALAPAADVFITQQLDLDLDFSTFELTDIGFGDTIIEVPEGLTSWQTRLDLTDTLGIWLDIDAGVDLQTGLASWTFLSIDPATGDLPDDPQLGFLPPNIMSPEGEGFVGYRINADANVASGARLDAQATIIFDTNEPIDTPLHFNTIDKVAPTSQISALPPETVGKFHVSLTSDDQSGSGAATFDIFVSTDGGRFRRWADDVDQTDFTFEGEPGHTYALYSVATDLVGNEELPPAGPDAVTKLVFPDFVTLDPVPIRSQNRTPTFTWNTITDADHYEVWLARLAPTQSRLFFNSSELTDAQFTPPEALGPGTYRLWARHFTESGQPGRWSDSVTFEIQPTLISPLTPTFDTRPTFSWEEIPFATGYQIFIRGRSEDIVETVTGTSWIPDRDLPEGPLRWWIRPANSIGNRGWSPTGHTQVDGQSRVLGPVGPTASAQLTISWQAVAGAGRYILYVQNLDNGQLALRQDHLTETSFTTSDLTAGSYRVWVKAINAETNSFSSGRWSRAFDIEVVQTLPDNLKLLARIDIREYRYADVRQDDSTAVRARQDQSGEYVGSPEPSPRPTEDQAMRSRPATEGTDPNLLDLVLMQEFVDFSRSRQRSATIPDFSGPAS